MFLGELPVVVDLLMVLAEAECKVRVCQNLVAEGLYKEYVDSHKNYLHHNHFPSLSFWTNLVVCSKIFLEIKNRLVHLKYILNNYRSVGGCVIQVAAMLKYPCRSAGLNLDCVDP